MGSGENGALTFVDILSILSFAVGLQNLELNIDQNDMDLQTRQIDERASALVSNALSELHSHLERQDQKIDRIIEVLNENHQEAVRND